MMYSVSKYGSDDVLFTVDASDTVPPEQQDQLLAEETEAISEAFQFIAETIRETAVEMERLLETFLKCHPNKRIVHLAFHGKTSRIRKKNRNRIFRDYIKAVDRDG